MDSRTELSKLMQYWWTKEYPMPHLHYADDNTPLSIDLWTRQVFVGEVFTLRYRHFNGSPHLWYYKDIMIVGNNRVRSIIGPYDLDIVEAADPKFFDIIDTRIQSALKEIKREWPLDVQN